MRKQLPLTGSSYVPKLNKVVIWRNVACVETGVDLELCSGVKVEEVV